MKGKRLNWVKKNINCQIDEDDNKTHTTMSHILEKIEINDPTNFQFNTVRLFLSLV